MKYLLHEGVQLYIPTCVEEERLVWDRLQELLFMECNRLLLWEPRVRDDNTLPGAWFPASAQFPVTRELKPVARYVEDYELGSRPAPPFVMVLDVALPTDYANRPLMTRWSPHMVDEDDRKVFGKLYNKVFGRTNLPASQLIGSVKLLYQSGFDGVDDV